MKKNSTTGDNGILTERSTKHTTRASRLGYIIFASRKGAPPAAIRLLIKLERIGFSTLLQYRSERKLRSAPHDRSDSRGRLEIPINRSCPRNRIEVNIGL